MTSALYVRVSTDRQTLAQTIDQQQFPLLALEPLPLRLLTRFWERVDQPFCLDAYRRTRKRVRWEGTSRAISCSGQTRPRASEHRRMRAERRQGHRGYHEVSVSKSGRCLS